MANAWYNINSSKFKLIDMPCSQIKTGQKARSFPFGATFTKVPVGSMGGGNDLA
jgi:hypothetical protein